MNSLSNPVEPGVEQGGEQRVHFANSVDPVTDGYLQQAAAAPREDASAALLELAAAASPTLLAVDVARFKYHFYRGELEQAGEIAEQALSKAATQGGFDADWRNLQAPLAGREEPEGPARYYLYALKASAFIALRSDAPERCRSLLERLETLDPDDLVGADTIRELAAAMEDEQ